MRYVAVVLALVVAFCTWAYRSERDVLNGVDEDLTAWGALRTE